MSNKKPISAAVIASAMAVALSGTVMEANAAKKDTTLLFSVYRTAHLVRNSTEICTQPNPRQ